MRITTSIQTLHKLYDLLEGINWRLVGGTNLVLQGVDIKESDIDIQIPVKVVKHVNQRLKEFAVQPIELSETDKYKSYFGKFVVNNVQVEIMTENVFKNQSPETPQNIYKNVDIKVGEDKIVCASLQEEYDIALFRNQDGKANAIKKVLDSSNKER